MIRGGMEQRALGFRSLTLLVVLLLAACSGLPERPVPKNQVLASNAYYVIVRVGQGVDARDLARAYLGDASLDWLIEEENGGPPKAGDIVAIPLHITGRSGVRPGRIQVVPVLCYHRFGDRDEGMTISAHRFRQQMEWLKEAGYRVIPLSDLMDFLEGNKRLPEKSVVLTIDDGHQSIYRIAYPILRDLGYPATVFIYSDYLGRGGLTWRQIHEMSRHGIDLQSHSKTHANLNERLPGESRRDWLRRIRDEVLAPTKKLRAKADTPVFAFAYPYGEMNETVVDLLEQHDYRLGFTVFPGPNPAFSYPYALHRSMIFGERDMAAFQNAVRTEQRFR